MTPGVAIPMLGAGVAYCRGVRALWAGRGVGGGVSRGRAACFAAAWVLLALALGSPLHEVAERRFSAHMIQHELLMLVCAPLFVLAEPLVPMLHGLPARWRRRVAAVGRVPWFSRAWRLATLPLVAWALHAAALWIWHAPALFDAAVANEMIHGAQHACFFGTALLFWWALVHRGRNAAGYGAALLAVFTTSLHSGVLGAVLTLAPAVAYRSYAGPPDALADQQLGGLLMWIPMGLLYMIGGLALTIGWLRDADRRVARWEAALVALACVTSLTIVGCESAARREAAAKTGGDPQRGRAVLARAGCGSCHDIPGVAGAEGRVGPPLGGIAQRVYLAGLLRNDPANLMLWIRKARDVEPKGAMPNVDLPDRDTRDAAAYLYTLR